MRNAGEIAPLIRSLSAAEARARDDAAAAIFQLGREIALAATQKWLEDAELASCFVIEGAGLVKTTVGIAVSPETFERMKAANGSPRLATKGSGNDTITLPVCLP